MVSTAKIVQTFHCDSEAEIDETLTRVCNEHPDFTVTKKEQKIKEVKQKGEVVDEYWIFTVTLEAN